MDERRPTREEAWDLLCEFTKNEGLRKHALAVEAAMRAMARANGEDEDAWGIVGLLHDFDYERYPEPPDHPLRGSEILAERGFPESWRRAILGHASYTGVPRDTPMAKALFAVDELSGFITAVALVRPNRSLAEVTVRSVRKKMKEKGFARSVNRDEIVQGAEEIDVDFDAHVSFVIEALRPAAAELGLEGSDAARH
ncbi:MAG: HDIG domain-containing protein [Candidatus Latescibacteria bacterium]|nr:HDIG domain-containing protein [Candidatus Latescibacterota bacterium]